MRIRPNPCHPHIVKGSGVECWCRAGRSSSVSCGHLHSRSITSGTPQAKRGLPPSCCWEEDPYPLSELLSTATAAETTATNDSRIIAIGNYEHQHKNQRVEQDQDHQSRILLEREAPSTKERPSLEPRARAAADQPQGYARTRARIPKRDEMDAKIAKLRFATDEAKKQLDFAQKLWQTAEDDLKAAKDKYRAMPQEKQETMQMNDTEMPELLETAMRAKQVYEDTKQRYETNLRYVNKFEMLAAGGSAAS